MSHKEENKGLAGEKEDKLERAVEEGNEWEQSITAQTYDYATRKTITLYANLKIMKYIFKY